MMILKNHEGTVLILVALVLLAVLIIGVSLMRSSVIETKIVKNEKEYHQDFMCASSMADFGISRLDDILEGLTVSTNTTFNISSNISGELTATTTCTVDVELVEKAKEVNPPTNSGYSVINTYANYYSLESRNQDQTVEVGAWIAFPKVD